MRLRSRLRFRKRLLLLLGAAVVLAGVSGVYFVRYLAKPNTGLVVNYPEVIKRDGRVLFSPKTPFSPAVASGLRPNLDQIIAIDGRAVQSIRDVVEADARIRGFGAFPVEVIREGEGKLSVAVTPSLNLLRPDWVFALLFCLTLTFTAFYLIIHLPEDTASNLIALAALFYLVFTAVKPFYYESFLSNLLIHFGKLTSWFMVFFALYFPVPRGSRASRLSLIGTILAVYLLFIVLRLLYFDAWARSGEDAWLERYRFLGQLNNIADGVAFVLYVVLLGRSHLKTPHVREKRQLEWIIAGFLIGVPPYFFLDQLPLILGEPPGLRISMGNFANLFLVFVPLFLVIGLLKHRVFNIRFFISRYAVYVALAAIVFSFFCVLYSPLRLLFETSYGLPEWLAGFLVTMLLFIVLIPLRSLLCNLVDRVFYRSHYRQSLRDSAELEQRNLELRLLIDEMNRQSMRSFQRDKLRELRGIVTGIAHRVNDPVNYVSASLAALDRKMPVLLGSLEQGRPLPPPEARQAGQEIRKLLEIAREGNLSLRDFLRKLVILAGSRPSVPVSVSVEQLLRSTVAELRRKHPEATVRLGKCAAGRVKCNPEEIGQALQYVLENALEASAASAGAYTTSADTAGAEPSVAAAAEGRYVRVTVVDHGPGMGEGQLRRAFDPFFTTKADHDGLGLFFSRMLIERSDGSVELRSTRGGGSTVTILLPREAGVLGQAEASREGAR
jgi:signal transduction histidine kinase